MRRLLLHMIALASSLSLGCAHQRYDVLIRGGTIYDGSASEGHVADVAIRDDRIAAIGDLKESTAAIEIDASGMAVAPGFINMLSWANESLIEDGRGLSDLHQGVTLEVMGEGNSMGPLTEEMKREKISRQGDIKYDIEWTTIGEYLDYLQRRGVSPNVASFVGATTVRICEIGYENRPPSPAELERMKERVDLAMREGAMGVSSALIYSPAFYADTDELIALAGVAAKHGGMYISHMRNEGHALLEAFDEFLTIARESGAAAEVYHIKASGRDNWSKLDELFRRIESARASGMKITADMYTYRASATGLNAVMPPWVQEGGHDAWVERLKDPAIRRRVKKEMNKPSTIWDNGFLTARSPDNILLVGFRSESLKPLIGKTLAEVSAMRGTSPEDTAMDLVVEDDSRVGCVFFTMSEENVRRKIQQPWVSICSDAGALAPEGVFLKSSTHPRAYGSFARLLGKYSRDEGVIPLAEAVRRMTSLPADNLGIKHRGRLKEGNFADVVVFDPLTIADRATFEEPHQLAVGVEHVFVNGEQVIKNGTHTGAKPGRVVRGPGWDPKRN